MGVVVVDPSAVALPLQLEAPRDPREVTERLGAGLDVRARKPEAAEGAPRGVVVELQVGDHRDLGPELEEACVALVCLRDDPLALPPAGVGRLAAGAGTRELAAEEEGGIRSDCTERPDAHRGRGRL